jgi:hypothetical protein
MHALHSADIDAGTDQLLGMSDSVYFLNLSEPFASIGNELGEKATAARLTWVKRTPHLAFTDSSQEDIRSLKFLIQAAMKRL